jgi:hypothetical protein
MTISVYRLIRRTDADRTMSRELVLSEYLPLNNRMNPRQLGIPLLTLKSPQCLPIGANNETMDRFPTGIRVRVPFEN